MTAQLLVDRLLNEAESPKKILRQLRASAKRIPGQDEVEYDLIAEPEDDDPRGHFDDPADVAFVREQINQGNIWGWCQVTVIAQWTDNDGNVHQGRDYLGGCSYLSRRDFMAPGGYYDDMKAEAYERLVGELEAAGFRKL